MVPDREVSINCHRTDTHQRFDSSVILANDGGQRPVTNMWRCHGDLDSCC